MTAKETEAMDCERFDKISLDLLYEELDELTAAAARRHLHHCTRCQGIFSRMNATREVGIVPLIEPPAGLSARILEAERHAHKALSPRARIGRTISVLAGYAMRPQLAMAALLLLMVGSSLVFLRVRPGERDQIRVTEGGRRELEAEPLARESVPRAVVPHDEQDEFAAAADSSSERSKKASARSEDEEGELDASGSSQAKFAKAMESYEAGRYAEAEAAFAKIAASGGPSAGRAALHEAHAARNGSGCQRAASLYDAVGVRYARTRVASEASWHAAACYQALGQTERAAAHYQNLLSDATYSARAREALAALEPDKQSEVATRVESVAVASAKKKAPAQASATPAAKPSPQTSAGVTAPSEPASPKATAPVRAAPAPADTDTPK